MESMRPDESEELAPVVEKKVKDKITVARTPLFTKKYATNVLVTHTDSDFRIELFNEKFRVEDKWVFHSDGLVILTFEAAKKLLVDLTECVQNYEEQNGEIAISSERKEAEFLI
ncbi:DUF3467 domain-containing protein [Methanolobus vulcani]|nr:DUF3467 domain-containing protein [Methanolobus vulcani]